MFVNQLSPDLESFSRSRVDAMAEELGLDVAEFNQCMDSDDKADEIEAMQREARQLGINGTPTLIINGEVVPYSGYADLKAKIEAELAAQ